MLVYVIFNVLSSTYMCSLIYLFFFSMSAERPGGPQC